jgi:hypothetical protein
MQNCFPVLNRESHISAVFEACCCPGGVWIRNPIAASSLPPTSLDFDPIAIRIQSGFNPDSRMLCCTVHPTVIQPLFLTPRVASMSLIATTCASPFVIAVTLQLCQHSSRVPRLQLWVRGHVVTCGATVASIVFHTSI